MRWLRSAEPTEVATLAAKCEALERERDEARETNRDLHRRTQEAETRGNKRANRLERIRQDILGRLRNREARLHKEHARVEAIAAKCEALERERDELRFECAGTEGILNDYAKANDYLAARVRSLEEALTKIEARCPKTEPEPAYDAYGWQIADTDERHAEAVTANVAWGIGEIARAALSREEGKT